MQFVFELVTGALLFIQSLVGQTTQLVPPVHATSTARVETVIDGDTIRVEYGNGESVVVRYIGIDTPEPYRDGKPACGSREATVFNADLVAGKTVTLVPDREPRDRYNRSLFYVYMDSVFVNKELVAAGYAKTLTIPPNTQHASVLEDAEREAREMGVGIWSLCENGVQ